MSVIEGGGLREPERRERWKKEGKIERRTFKFLTNKVLQGLSLSTLSLITTASSLSGKCVILPAL